MEHRTTGIHSFWTAILIALAAGCARATETPPFQPHQAAYEVRRGDSTIGRLRVELDQRDDGLWHYRIESRATAWYVRVLGISTTESAWFRWSGERVVPLTYHHVSREPGQDRFWQHRYDWEEMRSDTSTHAGESSIELADGVVDPLTLRLQVVATLARQAPDFESFELLVLERDEIEVQQYRRIGAEALQIGSRCFETEVFKRFRKEGSSRNYTAWHAASLGWMPVRIRHEDDGKPITLTLTDWKADGVSMPAAGACEAPDEKH